MFIAGMLSIVGSNVAHFRSRAMADDSKAQADRWGLFVGEWAPTLFALGAGLKVDELQQSLESKKR